MQVQPQAGTREPSSTLTSLGVLRRRFTASGGDPYASVDWGTRNAVLRDASGKEVFRQDNIEVPKRWSDRAVNIVAQHYLRGPLGTPQRETSVRQMVHRVVNVLSVAGVSQGLLTEHEAQIFYDELVYILLHQMAAFNSPVWYNVGVEDHPQASACFITGIEDSLLDGEDSILASLRKEATIFKYGSGSGLNLSKLREKGAPLSKGGTSSGVLSFMRPLDSMAGVIKSGGRTRRAATMRILNVEHPDILEFITCKMREEDRLRILIAGGVGGGLSGEAEQNVDFQSANHSVRVTDTFMKAVENDLSWTLKSRVPQLGGNDKVVRAKEVFASINLAAHTCADPGLQFQGAIDRMHTVPCTGPQNGANACSEFLHVDNTACNLASLNLCNLSDEPFQLPDIDTLRHVVDVVLTAQEILVDLSGYPTGQIAEMSHKLRPLGIGFGNLGALLMANGVPYDSDEGRRLAGALAALMTGRAYRTSAAFAKVRGPFSEFDKNRAPFLEVLGNHFKSARELLSAYSWPDIPEARNGHAFPVESKTGAYGLMACEDWAAAIDMAATCGVRNSQVSLLAPTGTISFLMDYDSTSGEPVIGLAPTKTMVGGAVEKMPFRPLMLALKKLGLSDEFLKKAQLSVEEVGHLDDVGLPPKMLKVFSCALPAGDGRGQTLSPEAHVLMVAAIQPFLSGGISKTVNLPHNATVEDVHKVHMLAWKSGCKSVSLYRDGCKALQPVSTGASNKAVPTSKWGDRVKLEATATSLRHKFVIGGACTGFLHVGVDAHGHPREVFLCVSKIGGMLRGVLDAWARAVSFALQLGMPLEELTEKFAWDQFEPAGFTNNPQVPSCTSITDYVARFLAVTYLGKTYARQELTGTGPRPSAQLEKGNPGASVCTACGNPTVRAGTCKVCTICGATSGCS